MANLRFPSSECVVCGSQYPHDVMEERDGDYVSYRCPECGSRIVNGVVATDGSFGMVAPMHTPPPNLREVTVGDDTDFVRFEMWWTDRVGAVAIHGRVVEGEPKLLDLVEYLSGYDS